MVIRSVSYVESRTILTVSPINLEALKDGIQTLTLALPILGSIEFIARALIKILPLYFGVSSQAPGCSHFYGEGDNGKRGFLSRLTGESLDPQVH